MRRLRTILADKDQGHAIAIDLAKGLPTLPAWMQDVVRRLLAENADATILAPRARQRKLKSPEVHT